MLVEIRAEKVDINQINSTHMGDLLDHQRGWFISMRFLEIFSERQGTSKRGRPRYAFKVRNVLPVLRREVDHPGVFDLWMGGRKVGKKPSNTFVAKSVQWSRTPTVVGNHGNFSHISVT